MCGIFATYSPHQRLDPDKVVCGTRSLTHRGPDETGFYFHPKGIVALGHRRLSIVGLSNGRQPIANEDRSIWGIVNGEFYDDEQQRRWLRSRGHRFRTESDSELLVHLYEEYGSRCVDFLQGEFALVVWDERTHTLMAARDRFGVKPLVYVEDESGLQIASEAKALFAAGVEARWDYDAFHFATQLQYLPPDRTLFQGIRKLPPAHLLIASESGTLLRSYWDMAIHEGERTEAERSAIVEECRHHVTEAVRCRLRAEVPIAVHLSGGLDSSVVAGLSNRMSPEGIDTFTVCFDEAQYDERRYAAETANHLGARAHFVSVTPSNILDSLAAAVRGGEGLAINGHLSAKYRLHQAMGNLGFRVALTGEGADEAFFGYAHLRMDSWLPSGTVPLSGEFANANQTSLGMMIPHGESLDLSSVASRLGYVPTWMRAKGTLGWKLGQLLHSDMLDSRSNESYVDRFVESVLGHADTSGASKTLISRKLWARTALAGYILGTLGDGTEMPHSIEGRVPFLDHRLWEFLSTVPSRMLVGDQQDKPLLREAMRGIVPQAIYDRSKHPFDAPPISFARNSLGQRRLLELMEPCEGASLFFSRDRFLGVTETLESCSVADQSAWGPVFMFMLSALELDHYLISQRRDHNHSYRALLGAVPEALP